AQSLTKRVLRHERFQLAGVVRAAPEGEIRLDSVFDRRQAQLVEARDCRGRERLLDEVDERRSTPEREPFAQARRGSFGVSAAELHGAAGFADRDWSEDGELQVRVALPL